VSPTLASLDEQLTSPAFFQDPYPVYRRLQEEAPVHWCEPWRQWVVTRHEHVNEVLMSPERFSSSGWEARFMSGLPSDVRAELPNLERHYATPVLSNTDPPGHRRLRTMVIKSFTPNVLKAMTPEIDALVRQMLDRLGERDRTELVGELAYPLPALVIARLLGADEAAGERYAEWSADIVAFVGTGRPEADRARRVDASLGEFAEHIAALIAEVRARPRADLLSLLAEEHGEDRLTDGELVATCVTLLFAGHETTANLIANGLLSLLRHPDQLALVREDPALMETAVEELLRFEGPVQRVRRVAREDTELGGQTIAEGDLVMAFLGAANRDPEVFEDADALDVRRDARHVAFGRGLHFCVGAGLSRIEAPIALNELLARFPELRLASDHVRWKPNITFRGLEALPLALR
jgi:pimeloyl-[acyl-carrier protein] synthase